jgi:hypothetical protein
MAKGGWGYRTGDLARDILSSKKLYVPTSKSKIIANNLLLKACALYVTKCAPLEAPTLASSERLFTAVVQCFLKELGIDTGKVDGFLGPQTKYAIDEWQKKTDYFRDIPDPKPIWPLQKDVPTFYGEKGENQVRIKSPYALLIAWNNSQIIHEFSVHEKVADSATRCMEAIFKEYGPTRIREFGLDQYGGSLNVRIMRGSKTQWSMHSWGIAIDWYPQRNQYKWARPKALFSQPEYVPFFEIWEAEGWVSLGRAKNYDWMHVQAARV